MTSLFTALQNVFVSLAGWFTSLFTASGAVDIFISVIFIMLVTRFILRPIFGGGGLGGRSDTAKKQKDGDSDV